LGTRVGQRVRELRTQAGLTLEQVAEFSAADADDETAPRLSKGHLSDVENGYARPTIATIQRLALALDVDLLDLLTFAEASPRQRLVEETRRLPQEAIDRLLRAAKKLSR
jgi:transcriptional regulator with XRE-family HTH domain